MKSVMFTLFQREMENFEHLVSIPNSGSSGVTTFNTDDPVDMFRNAVITLTTKGNVEQYMKPIIAKLKSGVTDMAVLNQIIDILFDHVRVFACFWLMQGGIVCIN